MEIVKQKITIFLEALETLEESIEIFNEYENLFIKKPTKKNKQLFLGMRDSMIQRFEYCTDLFWKVLKIYLENVEKMTIELSSPRGIIRAAVTARLLTEHDGDDCMMMVESRNKTSHIYHEQTAESIALHIPDYYTLMKHIINYIMKLMKSK